MTIQVLSFDTARITITSGGGSTFQTNQTITGTVATNAFTTIPVISVFDNGVLLGTTKPGGGAWSLSVALPNTGDNVLVAQASDHSGNVGTSAGVTFTVLPPLPPVVTAALFVDPGVSASDGITSNPTLLGTGDANATIVISEGGNILGTTMTNGSGLWQFTPSGLVDGAHTLVAAESNPFGTGTALVSFTLDRIAPTVAITSSGGLTNQVNQTISGTISDVNLATNTPLAIFDNGSQIGATAATGGVWTASVALAGGGTHNITVQGADLAGNTGTSNTDTLILDITAPRVVITSPSALTNRPNQTITGTVSDTTLPATPTITLLDNGNPIGTTTASAGVWSASITLAGDGVHNVTAKATDLAGNTGTSNTDVLTLDTLTPLLTEVLAFDTGRSVTDRITANPTVSGTADPVATVTISEGTNVLGQTRTDSAGNFIFTPTGLADGAHTLVAFETNSLGRTGTASVTFILKTTAAAPSGLAMSPPVNGNVTTVMRPTIVGQGEPGATVTLSNDIGALATATVASNGSWSITSPRLSPGDYNFSASETDVAGNLSTPSASIAATIKTPNFARFGSYNGDGSADLLFQLQNGGLMIDALSGNQVSVIAMPGQVGPEWQLEGVRDFDNDGTDDLLYERVDGLLQIDKLSNNTVAAVNTIGRIGPEWNLAGFGDFNGDRTVDVIWQRASDQMLMVYDIVNAAVSSTVLVGRIGPEWQFVSTADFNSDGTTDVLWERTTDHMLMIYNFQNNQVPALNLLGTVAPEWQVVGTGQFSSPSTMGVLFSRGDGTLMVDDIANNQIVASTIIGQIPTGWRLFGIGDTDPDGISDLIIRDDVGATAVEHIAGNQIASIVPVAQVGPEWRLFG